MPKYLLCQKSDLRQAQDSTLEEWLRAAMDAEVGDWFEGIGDLSSPPQVEAVRAMAQVVLNCSRAPGGTEEENRFIDFARTLESLLTGWRILPESSNEVSVVFQNTKGVCFETALVLGDTVLFQPRLSDEQRRAVRSDFKLPRMQANLTRNPESVHAGMTMGFLKDMELLSTLIVMWEKKAVRILERQP